MPAKVEGKVKLAIIGCGGISGGHAGAIAANPDKIECVALCDISEENLRRRSEQLGGVDAQYSDWKKMLDEMGDGLDAVDICLPHHLHADAILDAAAAGKHILCEKPMCIDLDDADKIVDAVKRAGITYMSAHNQLFMPAVLEAKRLIDAGEIGRVYWLRSQDCFAPAATVFKNSWRSDVTLQGGGVLIDTGYHPTYRLLYLADSAVIGVRGTMSRLRVELGGEDVASVQVRFANGSIGEILTAWAFPLPVGANAIHVVGEKGQIYGSMSNLNILRQGEDQPEKIKLSGCNLFAQQMSHFADCLRNGTPPIHGPEEGREVLRVVLEAAKDAEGWQQFAPCKA